MSSKRPGFQTSKTLALAMRTRPIGDADQALVQGAMAEIAPRWTVELQGLCDQEAVLVLLPEDGDDANGPSFMISRESYGVRLDQVHWDVVTEIGVFPSINTVINALAVRLALYPGQTVPGSVTIH